MCQQQHIIKITNFEDISSHFVRKFGVPFLSYGTPNSNSKQINKNDLALVLFSPIQFKLILS